LGNGDRRRNAGTVGAADLIAQHLSGAVLEKVSSDAGKGLFAGQRMARIGVLAMALN
jgi:hypothetical protein